MNTASRMESTGMRGKIHISGETAELLRAEGKEQWFEPREGKVFVKGKGEMQTYWLHTSLGAGTMSIGEMTLGETSLDSSEDEGLVFMNQEMKKHERLAKWNAELLCKYLKLVVARRRAGQEVEESAPVKTLSLPQSTIGNTVRDHVKAVLPFPEYQANDSSEETAAEELDEEIQEQARIFVHRISAMYNDNAFHNFEHASHVAMSVSKLLSRIITPDNGASSSRIKITDMELHDSTFGITSDPMMQFAVVFAALIHDVDHSGVVRLPENLCFFSTGNLVYSIFP